MVLYTEIGLFVKALCLPLRGFSSEFLIETLPFSNSGFFNKFQGDVSDKGGFNTAVKHKTVLSN